MFLCTLWSGLYFKSGTHSKCVLYLVARFVKMLLNAVIRCFCKNSSGHSLISDCCFIAFIKYIIFGMEGLSWRNYEVHFSIVNISFLFHQFHETCDSVTIHFMKKTSSDISRKRFFFTKYDWGGIKSFMEFMIFGLVQYFILITAITEHTIR